MEIFGSDCYAFVPREMRRKLDEKAVKLKFVGYDEQTKGFRLVDPATMKVTISRDVKFLRPSDKVAEVQQPDEVQFYFGESCKEPDETDDDEQFSSFIDEDEASTEVGSSPETVLRRSSRSNLGQLPARYGDFAVGLMCKTKVQEEPGSYEEAMASDDRDKWLEAMKDELRSIEANETWDLVDLPEGRTAVGSKWVLKIKRDELGNISRYKARIVAQGFRQKPGEDFTEVYAPVARHTTFRTLLSVAAKRRFVVRHYDAKTAFLNGRLTEDIYMRQPPGFAAEGQANKVCKLKKSLYGLKQAARAWNEAIDKRLKEVGLIQSCFDPCLYFDSGRTLFVLIYVDDLVIASEDEGLVDKVASALQEKFEISCLGNIKHYLGMQIERDDHGDFWINQTTYINEIVRGAGLMEAKNSNTPIDVGYYKLEEGQLLDSNTNYQRAIGQLLYVSVNSRPDISASVSILAQKVSKPTETDWNQVRRVVRYLKGTATLKLRISRTADDKGLVGFCDANFAEDKSDRKSNSGFIFMYNGGAISWASRKQTTVAKSTAEAEYVSLAEASQEGVWLTHLLEELGEDIGETVIFEDNQSALKMIESEKFSCRTKHMDVKYHFVKDLSKNGFFKYVYCGTEDMVADLLTKPLGPTRLEKLRTMMGLVDKS
jgi:hypothetical protein